TTPLLHCSAPGAGTSDVVVADVRRLAMALGRGIGRRFAVRGLADARGLGIDGRDAFVLGADAPGDRLGLELGLAADVRAWVVLLVVVGHGFASFRASSGGEAARPANRHPRRISAALQRL